MAQENSRGWVAKRVKSRMAGIFKELSDVVQRDVEEMNQQVSAIPIGDYPQYPEMRLCEFECDPVHTKIMVHSKNLLHQGAHVTFALSLKLDSIGMKRYAAEGVPNSIEQFTIDVVQWDDKKHAYLPCIDGTRYTVEDVSRKALEPLFFPKRK